jgi:hypothetical protein
MVAERKVLDAYVQLSARGASAVGSAMKSVEGVARGAYGSLQRVAEIAAGNAIAAGFSSIAGAVASIPGAMISANASYEQAAVSLEVLLGSADAAKKRIADLNTFAATTPFELPGILQASKQLEMAKIPAEEHQKVLRMTGDMAAAAGVDISELGMWVSRAYQQIQAGEPFGEAAQRMSELGVLSVDSRAKLEQMTKAGASSTEVWKEFENAMGRFEGMTDKQAKTFNGLMSSMSDGVNNTLRVFGEPMFNIIKAGVDRATAIFGSDGWEESVRRAGENVVAGLQSVADWFAPLIDGGQQIAETFLSWFDGVDILGTLDGALSVMSDTLGVVMEIGQATFGAILEMAQALGSVLWDVVIGSLDAVGLTASDVGDGIGSVWDWIIDKAKAVAAAIRNWDLSFQYVWIYAQNFGLNLVEMLGAFIANAQIVFQDFPAFASAAFGAVMQLMENLGTNIGNLATSIGTYIGEILSGNLLADFNVDFKPLMEGVAEQLEGLPDLVEAQTQSARERFGKELDALDSQWNTREAKREQRIAQRRDAQGKLIAQAAGLDKEEPAAGPGDQKKVAAKADTAGKKEKAVAITDVAAFWEKLQGASTKAGEKKAEQQREKQVTEAQKQTKLLEKIAESPAGAVLA